MIYILVLRSFRNENRGLYDTMKTLTSPILKKNSNFSVKKRAPTTPQPQEKKYQIKIKLRFRSNFCLVVTILIRLLLSIWDVENPNSISNKLFFRWWFFLVVLSQINFSDCDINFHRNQYEMNGKSDIWLWCLIHVFWGWFVDFGLKSFIIDFSATFRNPQNWWKKEKKFPTSPQTIIIIFLNIDQTEKNEMKFTKIFIIFLNLCQKKKSFLKKTLFLCWKIFTVQ